MELATVLCTTVVALLIITLNYFKWAYKYWEKKSVPFIEPSIPFGNSQNPFRTIKPFSETLRETYDHFKSMGAKHGGIYLVTRPTYIPVDPELIKHVLTIDFQHFTGHGITVNEKIDPLSAHLFNLDGERWRNMRVKLTPTFTSGKMKMMFQTLVDCGDQMKDHMDKLASSKDVVDIKEISGCYATDVIGSCAFGLECNSFKDPDAEFRKYGRKIFHPTFSHSIGLFLNFCFPGLFSHGIPKDISNFFTGVFADIVNYRRANDFKRNDFVQILMEMNKSNGDEKCLTMEQMTAQAFVFFLAGFETSSTTMTFCLFELARNKDIQMKLRDEICEVIKKHDNKLTYDVIMEMKYMDQVINETLRKYPPAPIINRVCTKDYVVPHTEVVIENGTKVFISVLGLHRDPEYYPNPDNFDPGRFSKENVAERRPYTFLPFGEGPRMCIGLRFGLMQTKVGLSLLLKHYLVSLNEKTQLPLEFDPKGFILSTKGTIWLDIEKIIK